VLPVVPNGPDLHPVLLDEVGDLAPVTAVELGSLVDENHRARVERERARRSAHLQLLDGQRGREPAELLSHPAGGGAVHRDRQHLPAPMAIRLRSRVQRRPLPGPCPPGQTHPASGAAQQLERAALLTVESSVLPKRPLSRLESCLAIRRDRCFTGSFPPRRPGGDGHDALFELADLPGGDSPAGELQQIAAALGALHPSQFTPMIRIRNSKLVTAIVAVIVSMSAVGMSPTATRGAPHPPVVALAVLPPDTRLQKERRNHVKGSISLRVARRLRGSKVWRRRRRLNFRPRLPIHQWDARGPPRRGGAL
jgi:hypothetical protein